MVLIVGLGNPGAAYAGTRHNVGFDVVDLIAEGARARFSPGRGEFWTASCSLNDTDIVLLKPTTFMNTSGVAVLEAMDRFSVAPEQLLVVCDDAQLPLGTMRIRPQGSDGGHHGLGSIIYHLQTDQFPRVRCGIGSPAMPKPGERLTEFVLDRFLPEEVPAVRTMLTQAREACLMAATDGIGPAMNRFNSRPEPPQL